MIVSVHQPQYLPWLGYFHKMYQSDAFVFLDNVQYKKREYQNRNRIRTKNDSIWLTVPVIKDKNPYPNISSVRIDNSQAWQKRHWRAILLNYSRAPYFKKYSDYFEEIYKKEWNMLADLNMQITKYIAQSLDIGRPIYLESQLGVTTTNTARIIDICKALKADAYLSGIGGKEYLDEKQFDLNGIKLIYQDFKHPEYTQCYEPFIPYMSIIDLLFNYGDDSLKVLISGKTYV
jgi:WbqC-like protein family